MQIPTAVMFVALFLCVAIGWFGLFFITPWSIQSILRHKYWQLRDEVMDDVIAGRLPDNKYVNEFISSVERSISATGHTTALQLLLTHFSLYEQKSSKAAQCESFDNLSSETQQQMEYYYQRYLGLFAESVFHTSPSGWILLAVVGTTNKVSNQSQQFV
jgi:hypothetical protein